MKALLLSVALLLAAAAPAEAAQVVRIDGARLDAADDRRDLCLRVTLVPQRHASEDCGPVPLRAPSTSSASLADGGTVYVGGAAPAAVARVEAEGDGGERVAADTVAGPRYRGRHAGRLRFFLLAVPSEGIVLLRAYGADGALLGAVQPDRREDLDAAAPEPVLTQRRPGRAIVLTGHATRVFAPTPLALDRFETQPCLRLRTRRGSGGSGGGACRAPGPFRPPLDLATEAGCGPLRSIVYGFVGEGIDRVRLHLGSGRVRTVPTRTLASFPAARYVAERLPRGEALRSVSAVGSQAKQALGEPPGGLPCSPASGGFGFGLAGGGSDEPRPPAAGDQVAVEADGHRLLVRDAEDERLCVNVDALNADASDCDLPQVDLEFGWFPWRGRFFGGAVPTDIARVRLPGGRELATVTGEGYTGRYAGALRFVIGKAPARGGWAALLGADGARLGRAFVGSDALLRPGRKVTVARGKGWRLTAQRFASATCLHFVPGDCLLSDTTAVNVAATCSPRRALLYGAGGGMAVVLRSGRVLRPQVIGIPRRHGGGRVFVLPLPRRAEVVALRRGGKRTVFPVLPAREQCGYRLYESIH